MIKRQMTGFLPKPSPDAVGERDRMIRVGMSLYLMLVLSAGPSFCCCSFTRLARWLLTPLRTEQASPSANGPACCCPPRAPDKSPEKPDHLDRPTCLCREDGSGPSALSALQSDITRAVERNHLDPSVPPVDFVSSAVVATPPAGIIQIPGADVASHFLTARDMLRAHHVLRC
jgi:hypothetical protein